ncbi:hypothetical protein WICPIJ_000543 [Wickerhamomyces pijperi]|uniref:Uncharacterized protein n=1 Tax=Wickerhamomyces pijperi TaxID=599730 RepID=A0A9P8QGC6_WICPI|nr:hypothetical protein WICPIJ_000543 [Wickerhamomyces pijperi]
MSLRKKNLKHNWQLFWRCFGVGTTLGAEVGAGSDSGGAGGAELVTFFNNWVKTWSMAKSQDSHIEWNLISSGRGGSETGWQP